MDELLLKDYLPTPQLVVPEHHVEHPRFPAIDAHNHLMWGKSPDDTAAYVAELLRTMDKAGIQMIVDLTRAWDEGLQVHLDALQTPYPDRFSVFACINWTRLPEMDDFGTWAANSLADSVRRGARGLKVFKEYGLRFRDADGQVVAVDDPRVAPLWDKAAELDVPVLIHVADPAAFFHPLDCYNERYEELIRNPDWHFYGPEFPTFCQLMEQWAHLVERHPGTRFIGAHVGCYPENLGFVSDMLTRCPNFYVDMSARIAELGRQPYSARRFFLRHSDRILFGTDVTPNVEHYRIHYRFLETEDEHFDYGLRVPPAQGRWRIYGINLPEDVLAKVYYDNARRVLFGNGGPLPTRGK